MSAATYQIECRVCGPLFEGMHRDGCPGTASFVRAIIYGPALPELLLLRVITARARSFAK